MVWCVGFGLQILHKTLHCVGLRGEVCRVVGKQKNINVGLGGNMQKRGFHPTFLLFEGTCVAEKRKTKKALEEYGGYRKHSSAHTTGTPPVPPYFGAIATAR